MVPKVLRLVSLAVVALVLAACQIIIVPYDPVVAETISAQDSTEPSAVRSSVLIGPGETLVYDVRVPTARDLLYGEANGDGLRVRWRDRRGWVLAVSQTPRWFVASTADLSATELGAASLVQAEVGRRVIVDWFCFGPCAAIAPGDSRYYLEITNRSPSTQTFDLYAYTFEANDLNDRGSKSNQTAGTATPFGPADSPSGAIELVGDVDWFRYTGSTERVLRFTVLDEVVGLVMQFEDGFTLEGTTAGLTTTVRPDERFRVFSSYGRAGPSGTSGYRISLP